jgi:hypothetical protein
MGDLDAILNLSADFSRRCGSQELLWDSLNSNEAPREYHGMTMRLATNQRRERISYQELGLFWKTVDYVVSTTAHAA